MSRPQLAVRTAAIRKGSRSLIKCQIHAALEKVHLIKPTHDMYRIVDVAVRSKL